MQDEDLKLKLRICAILAGFFGFLGAFGLYGFPWILVEASFAAAGFCLLGALILKIRLRQPKYDLNALKKIHDREELRRLEDEGVGSLEFDSFVCMGCGEPYSMRLPICPRCKLPQGQPPCG